MNMVQQFDPAQVDYSQDLGTPGAESDVMVTVRIDGMPVSVPEGTFGDARRGHGRSQYPQTLRHG